MLAAQVRSETPRLSKQKSEYPTTRLRKAEKPKFRTKKTKLQDSQHSEPKLEEEILCKQNNNVGYPCEIGVKIGSDSTQDYEIEEAVNCSKKEPDNLEHQDLYQNLTSAVNNDYICEDISDVKERIAEILGTLENWNNKEEESKLLENCSRQSLINDLVKKCSIYYDYSLELSEYFIRLLGPREAVSFFEAAESPKINTTLRSNTLYTRRGDLARMLISKGVNVDPLPWSKVGLSVLESNVSVGCLTEYCAGFYTIQSASSLLPVMALSPEPNETILDMTAAPGGKTTFIAQLMKNSGVLFCNELKKDRIPALVANIHRMGITNTVVTNMDGKDLIGRLPPLDRVLLDAPCSGLATMKKDPSVKIKRSVKDFRQCAESQKKLLRTAVDLVDASSKTGGYIVYSTCSLSLEENEEVIDYIVTVRNVKVVPTGITNVGVPAYVKMAEKRFHSSLKNGLRVYPHTDGLDGFFICKLKKFSNEIPQRVKKDRNKKNSYVKVWDQEKIKEKHLVEKPIDFRHPEAFCEADPKNQERDIFTHYVDK